MISRQFLLQLSSVYSVLESQDSVTDDLVTAYRLSWGAGMVICLERGADLHTAQLMPLPLTASRFSNPDGFSFLVPAHPGSLGQRAIKWVCICMYVYRLSEDAINLAP